MDLVAVEEEFLPPFKPTLVRTGLAMELPIGVEGQIRPRSGLALKKGITVWNAPGTLDPTYRGEVGVILLSCSPKGSIIEKGDRIAQIVFSRYVAMTPEEVDTLSDTLRGEGGFGSTGH
jgi:dUTP pyrophosphatase